MESSASFQEMVKDALSSSYKHPYVIIDKSQQILKTNGDTRSFLLFSKKKENVNLLEAIKPELRLEINELLARAIEKNSSESGKINRLSFSGGLFPIRIIVKPLVSGKSTQTYFLIIFEKLDVEGFTNGKNDLVSPNSDENTLSYLKKELKNAKLAQERTEKNLNRILEQSMDVFCTLDETGKFLWLSEAAINLLGYRAEELKGKSFLELVSRENRFKSLRAALELMKGKSDISFENSHIRSDGSIIPINWSARWYPDEKIAYCLGRDATSQKEAASKLKTNEALLSEAQRVANMGSWNFDFKQQQLIWSDASYDVFGLKKETFSVNYRSFLDLVVEGYQSMVAHTYRRFKETGEPFSISYQILTADGEERIIEEQGYSEIDEDGTIVRLFGTVQNVTERKKAEEEIKSSNQRFKYVTQATSDVIWDWDLQAKRVYWGDNYQEIFGEIPSYNHLPDVEKVVKRLHPEEIANVIESSARVVKSKENHWAYEHRYLKSDGSYAYVSNKALVIRGSNGRAIRVIGAMHDITKSRRESIQKQFLSEISQIFKREKTLHSSLVSLLSHLMNFGKFQIGEIWLLNTTSERLDLFAHHADQKRKESFYGRMEKEVQLSEGEGLPGMVWQSKQMVIWDDIYKKESFIRREAALASGLLCAFGIPLSHYGEFTGVLLLGSVTTVDKLLIHKPLFKELEDFLGSEIQRKELEEQLIRIYDAAPEIVCVAGFDGFFKKVNPSMCSLLGYSEEEILKTPIIDFTHPEDREKTQNEFAALNGGIGHLKFENRFLTKSGKTLWLSWSTNIFQEEKITYSVAKDITEQKELELLLDNATKLAKIGGWEIDLMNKSFFWSSMTKEIHEVPADFLPDLETGINFYREDAREEVKSIIRKAIQEGKAFDFEIPLVTAKGNEKWVRVIGNMEYRDGRCVRIYGSFQDIHAKKLAEMRLQVTADNIPGVIFKYHLYPDGSDKITQLTKGAYDLYGYSPRECVENINLIWDQTKAGGDFEAVRASIMKSAKQMERWHCQYRSKRPDGKILWHEGFGTPQKQPDNSIVWDSLIIDISEKKKLEDLLARASKLARIGSWEMETREGAGKTMYWSPSTREIYEVNEAYSPTLAKNLTFFKGDSNRKIREAIEKLIQTGEEYDLELMIETARGNKKWIRSIGQSEWFRGKCQKIYGSIQDIHLRKLAEEKQRKLLQERNNTLESIGDGFFAVDKDWIITYWNRKAEQILGKPKEEVLGANLWEIYQDKAAREFFPEYSRAMEKQEVVNIERYYRGLNIWVEISIYPSAEGLSVYFKDVTEKKLAFEAVKTSNERFKLVNKATNDAIYDWNISTGITLWGDGFERILGYKAENFTQLDQFIAIIAPEQREGFKNDLSKSLKQKDSSIWEREYVLNKKDGSMAEILERGYILRDKKSGEALRMVGALNDITQRKVYENSLKQLNTDLKKYARDLSRSNAELEQFAYIASHDLQEPLRMVTSFLTQLEKKYDKALDEKAHQYIHFAVDGARRMRQIILDLLEFSRVGRMDGRLVELDVGKLLEDVLHLQRKSIEEKNASFAIDPMPVIKAFRSPMVQIFQNLIENALKYNRKHIELKINIKAIELPDAWQFLVEDNGIGIEKQYFDKIFVLFQRLHKSDQYAGTGMGLAIVKKHVENLNGNIWVNSVVGKGTDVYFTIPKNLEEKEVLG
ncbi:PAS domain S-box protein [Cyclobacterium sp.]|uniref:PAS domain S-box protein n=1 Tax=Cyclobacterium sp. TaxID=1966343 RepID=UPI00199AB7FF|nr:PAS domain S-box protein [Cyclobacterium sp.]MBD3630773.1 PAS domain S-box protein [Cyclobacterium sp.]